MFVSSGAVLTLPVESLDFDIRNERVLEGDCSGPRSAQAVLLHPRVDVAVLEVARGGILREGLGFDWCSVGVVTNLSRDHLGSAGINTMEQLARVKQVVVESVDPDGSAVLNADDPLVAEMAAATKGQVVYYLVTAKGSNHQALVELSRITFTAGGAIRFQLENALAATAAAWASGLNPALIVRALTTFRTDTRMVPGRFNVLGVAGRQVILDYAHNLAAMKALSEALPRTPDRRTIMVIGLPGDRRDEDLLATMQATLPMADEYVLHDLKDRRGRAELEVPQLMKSCLPPDRGHQFAREQREGVERAFQMSREGDRIIVIADLVDEALEAIHAMAGTDEVGCETPVTQAYD